MQEKKKFITLHYVSILFLILTLFFIVLFLFHRATADFILFLVSLTVYLLFTHICSKALQCEDGYSIVQAIRYYRACEYAGYRGSNKKKDVDILNKTAKNRDILENAESKDLKHCFEIGREAAKAVTNPFVLMIWSLRDRIAKRGGKKHV